MKENSDLSNLFPTLTIAKDLEEVWQYLCDGKYLVGADLTLYRRTPFVMENAFCLSNGFIRMFKVKWASFFSPFTFIYKTSCELIFVLILYLRYVS